MKIRFNLEMLLYAVLIVLSMIAIALTSLSYLFTEAKVLYQGF